MDVDIEEGLKMKKGIGEYEFEVAKLLTI